MGVHIADELKNGSNLIDLYFDTGRKHSDKGWHTYIGKDACDALREWFSVRGYPTANDPYIWPSEKPQTRGAPSTVGAVQQNFARLAGHLGFRPKFVRRRNGKQIPPIGESHSRYGVSVKELRDLSLSLAQQAVGKENDLGERFQESSAEYFAGHTIDDLGYRKLHQLDPGYRKRQYQIVEPYLSPVSSPNGAVKSRVEELEGRLTEMQADMVTFDTDDLAKIWAAKTKEERQAIRERLFKS
jgi:hypothetical protein